MTAPNHGFSFRHYLALNQKEKQAVKAFVSAIRKNLKSQLLEAKIFGSKVRGDFSQDSDIDILIILKERSKYLIDVLYENLLVPCLRNPLPDSAV